MRDSLEKNGTSLRGRNENQTSRASTAELVDFVSVQARKLRVKEVQRLTGLSVKAIENMRLGLSGASAQTITTWCRNDPSFRAAYFAYCGGLLESDPEMVAALSKAINAIVRRVGA